MNTLDVSVVVPNLDGGEMLLETLRSAASAATQLIVVDNGSRDDSPHAAGRLYPDARIIRNERNEGFAEACNRGAAAAAGRYVLFINNDARLDAGALEALIEAAERDPSGAVWQPLILFEDGSIESAGDLFTRTGFLWHLRAPLAAEPYPVFAAMGACMLVRREVFLAIGGFVGSYFAYFEEADLCWRARLAGWEVRVVPGARVMHRSGTTSARILRPEQIYYLSYRNRLRSVLANTGARTLARVLPVHIGASLAIALGFLGAGRAAPALALLRALVWPLVSLGAVRGARRSVQGTRKVSDGELLRPELVVRLTPRRAAELFRGNLRRW